MYNKYFGRLSSLDSGYDISRAVKIEINPINNSTNCKYRIVYRTINPCLLICNYMEPSSYTDSDFSIHISNYIKYTANIGTYGESVTSAKTAIKRIEEFESLDPSNQCFVMYDLAWFSCPLSSNIYFDISLGSQRSTNETATSKSYTKTLLVPLYNPDKQSIPLAQRYTTVMNWNGNNKLLTYVSHTEGEILYT